MGGMQFVLNRTISDRIVPKRIRGIEVSGSMSIAASVHLGVS